MRTVVIFSGGLDSTTLIYHLRALGHEVKALTVNYGQRHFREIEAAKTICERIGIEQRVINLADLSACFGQDALTNDCIAVPTGEYAEPSMKVTTVPNRNMIMLSIAIAWAITLEFDSVAFGAHGGDYVTYPDCRPSFASAMNEAAALCDWHPVRVLSPFVNWDKSEIVQRGCELDVPFELTWSCYKGLDVHCGLCSTCLDRQKAFTKTSHVDPVTYASQG